MYLDNAAHTTITHTVLSAMMPYLTKSANPSSIYSYADESRNAVEKARKQIADLINVSPSEIYFTSGGTESNNWVMKQNHSHIITSAYEHPSILNSIHCRSTLIPILKNGKIDMDSYKNSFTPETTLVSIMTANNELGTVNDIYECAKIAHTHNCLFHTDAVQALPHMKLDASKFDLLSASGHKFHAPMGTGFLYIKEGTPIKPFMEGGHQENSLRAGTLNVPGIVGLGQAAAELNYNKKLNYKSLLPLLKNYVLNVEPQIPTLSIRFPNVDNDTLLALLDIEGIYASAGSACNSGNKEPSHVLTALGLTIKEASETIRLSFDKNVDINYLATKLNQCVERIREL